MTEELDIFDQQDRDAITKAVAEAREFCSLVAELAQQRADYIRQWEARYRYPYPRTPEDWQRLAALAGLDATIVFHGQWKPADVLPVIEGYLLRRNELVAPDKPSAIDLAKCSAAPELVPLLKTAFSDALAATIPPMHATPTADAFTLERYGDGWRIEAFGECGHFQDLLGLQYLAELLQRPNVAIPVELLVREESAMPARDATVDHGELDTDGHSVQPIADKEALEDYWRRLQELDTDIAEAEREGCVAEVEELQQEREALLDEINAACGRGGKPRAFSSDGDRLRPAVRGALRRVYQRMRAAKPAMARTADHLESSIMCEGNAFVYRGASLPNWRIIS